MSSNGARSPKLSRPDQAAEARRAGHRLERGGPRLRDHRAGGEARARGPAPARGDLRARAGEPLPGHHQPAREPHATGAGHARGAPRDARDLSPGDGPARPTARRHRGAGEGGDSHRRAREPVRPAADRPSRGRRGALSHRGHLLCQGSRERDVELRLQPPHDQGARHDVDPSDARQAPVGVPADRRGARRAPARGLRPRRAPGHRPRRAGHRLH